MLKHAPVHPVSRLAVCAAVLFQLCLTSAVNAADRVALVIGNGRYQKVAALANPPNDARAMAATLRKLGFDVSEATDLKRQDMEHLVAEFLKKAAGVRLALFFYAGHGVQVDGKNYLVPIDAEFDDASDLSTRAVEVGKILDGVSDAARSSILVLDACRDNPFTDKNSSRSLKSRAMAAAQGLAAYSTIGRGSLIAYSTAPDQVALDGQGANSPFTTALVKYLPSPSLEVRQVMTRVRSDVASVTDNKQIPWDNSSLMGDVYLGADAKSTSPATSVAMPAQPSPPGTPGRSSSPAPALDEDCLTMNPATTRAAFIRNTWKLVDGNHWILDFDDKADQAKHAEQIVKYYNLSRYCFVRRPKPSFIYWLVGDQSAVGSMPNEDCVSFNPGTTKTGLYDGLWKVVDGNHAMFALPNQSDAERAVAIIKHYGFNRSCFVGRPGPTMSYLRR
jgi:hypothetical protein